MPRGDIRILYTLFSAFQEDLFSRVNLTSPQVGICPESTGSLIRVAARNAGKTVLGLEPTGRKINVTETLILRLEGEEIAETWEDYDEYGLRTQLGLIKPS